MKLQDQTYRCAVPGCRVVIRGDAERPGDWLPAGWSMQGDVLTCPGKHRQRRAVAAAVLEAPEAEPEDEVGFLDPEEDTT